MYKRAKELVLKRLGLVRKKWMVGKIVDKDYRVIAGSIRIRPDKDDAWLFALGREHNVIFDIGCNIGQAALMLLYHANIRKIVLVDPNPSALAVAAENLIHNNLSNKATFVNAFIADKCNETVDFYTESSGAAGSRYKGFAKTAASRNSHFSVSTLTVDYLADYYNILPGLIKVDVEGAEREVLKGAVKVAAGQSTLFFVEIHSGPELNILENTGDILEWCKQNHYTAWYLKTKEILELDAIKSRGRFHALLVPDTMKFPEALKSIIENAHLR